MDNKPTFVESEPLQVQGKVSEKQAKKELESFYHGFEETGVKDIIITSLEETNATYEMDLDYFIKNSNKIEKGDN